MRRHAGTAILDLQGEIDGLADHAINRAYAEAVSAAPVALLLNFGGVEYINSTGIAVIVSVLAQACRDRIPVLACGLSDHYQEIFRITRLSDFIRVYRDEGSALASV